jgi:hypothetical protein
MPTSVLRASLKASLVALCGGLVAAGGAWATAGLQSTFQPPDAAAIAGACLASGSFPAALSDAAIRQLVAVPHMLVTEARVEGIRGAIEAPLSTTAVVAMQNFSREARRHRLDEGGSLRIDPRDWEAAYAEGHADAVAQGWGEARIFEEIAFAYTLFADAPVETARVADRLVDGGIGVADAWSAALVTVSIAASLDPVAAPDAVSMILWGWEESVAATAPAAWAADRHALEAQRDETFERILDLRGVDGDLRRIAGLRDPDRAGPETP